ncbi:MAG: alpha/beta fold hydrolase [Candidatus Nanopelagicales bacterium]|nr:alpha/beta fold hydrolase [Candidatus Nanopelagicales bacterium]
MQKAARGVVMVLVATMLTPLAGCGGSTDSPASPTPTATARATVDTELGRIATDFITALVDEDFSAAVGYFDDTMLKTLPAADLKTVWAQVIDQAGGYRSELSRTQEEVDGYDVVIATTQFENAVLSIRMVFDSDQAMAGLFFQPATAPTSTSAAWQPPLYADTALVTDVEVTIGEGQWQLPGTLTTPTEDGPWPGVVLVHGSGPNDRAETIGPNKPFRDLALGLASRGIAVLAYDKRSFTHGAAMADMDGMTVQDEVVDDAVLAVELLRATDGVDPDRVWLLGHSLGGMLAPRIAEQADGLAGLVILAGAGRPLEELILEQTRYLGERDGTLTAEERSALDKVQEQVAAIRDPDLEADTPAADLLGVPASYWLDLRGYQPPAVAATLDVPILVLQGERDYQVTMADFGLWKEALGTRDDVTFTSFPELNHLMIPAPERTSASPGTKVLSGPEEYQVAGHVDQAVIDAIASHILG